MTNSSEGPGGPDHGGSGASNGVGGPAGAGDAPSAGDVSAQLRHEADRRRRIGIIALSGAAGLVLIAGIIASAATGSDDGSPVTASPTTAPDTTVPTSSTSTTSTTSTTSSTTTSIPLEPVANAGPDLAVDAGTVVTLTAVDLVEGTGDDEVVWEQLGGPDVTSGVGALGGASVSFSAPSEIVTLTFELQVAGVDQVARDELVIRVFEDADRSVFVDGERGDDGADGSAESPFRTIGAAAAAADGRDLYVRTVGTYDERGATIELGENSSLYGGFDENWKRDASRRAVIDGAATAIRLDGLGDRWLSAIEVSSADAGDDRSSIAIRVVEGDVVTIDDSRIVSGDGGRGSSTPNGGSSIGVLVNEASELRVLQSTVNAARGGDGRSGSGEAGPGDRADAGEDASGRVGGDGADAPGDRAGGDGGNGGETSNGGDAPGGGDGGSVDAPDGEPGGGGPGGDPGAGGDGGAGLLDGASAFPVGADGEPGGAGGDGVGGRGGGGGFGPLFVQGGGGGGGGAGGAASAGGAGGGGAGGSVGIWAIELERLTVFESLLAGARGGDGGTGAPAPQAENGGDGGDGAPGVDGLLADGGDGGGGGSGGAGGTGGQGGGGAGGPSFGLLTSDVDVVEVVSSEVRGGRGGDGADGGVGGTAGNAGGDGSGRGGGDGGGPGTAEGERGAGASGGSSFGWFDDSGAVQVLNDAEFIQGEPGSGGSGSTTGAAGVAGDANV